MQDADISPATVSLDPSRHNCKVLGSSDTKRPEGGKERDTMRPESDAMRTEGGKVLLVRVVWRGRHLCPSRGLISTSGNAF